MDAEDNKGWIPLLYADFAAQEECILTLIEINPRQLSVLGKLVRDPKSLEVVRSTMEYIARVPKYYGVLNDFIRSHIGKLRTSSLSKELLAADFAFLLEKKELLDFDNKKKWFRRKLDRDKEIYSRISNLPNRIVIDRFRIFEDTVEKLGNFSFRPRAPLEVSFKDEAGFGAGVKREFFQAVCQELLNESRGLFRLTGNKSAYEINPDTSASLSLFHFAGYFTSLAIYHNELLDLRYVWI